MEKYGYAPNPFCDKCNGYGLVHPLTSIGKPDYSQVTNCCAPGCLDESIRKYKAGEKSFLAHGLTSWSHVFSNYKPVSGTIKAYRAFKDMAEGDSNKPFLFCYGGTGNGKTHLCEAATIRLLQRGIDAWYYTAAGLMSLLKRSIQDNTVEKTLEILSEVECLVIDDWGDLSDWEEEKLKDIIDNRYRFHRLTITTSNRALERLIQRNERVISRFRDAELSVTVLNEGSDYRPLKR